MTKVFTPYVVPKNIRHVIGAQKCVIVIMITKVHQALIIGTLLNLNLCKTMQFVQGQKTTDLAQIQK